MSLILLLLAFIGSSSLAFGNDPDDVRLPISFCEQALSFDIDPRLLSLEEDLARLRLPDPHLVEPRGFLGLGGNLVITANYHGKTYALKLMRPIAHLDSLEQAFFELEVSSGVVIQSLLGELGVSPKVIGFIDGSDLPDWTKLHKVALESIVQSTRLRENESDLSAYRMGLLMELVPGLSSKDKSGSLMFSKEAFGRARIQAKSAAKILHQNHILPMDVEWMITPAGDISLINIGLFNFIPPALREHIPLERIERSLVFPLDLFFRERKIESELLSENP